MKTGCVLHTLTIAPSCAGRGLGTQFVKGVNEVRANMETHPEFGGTLEKAKTAGVEVIFLPCHVEPDELTGGFQ